MTTLGDSLDLPCGASLPNRIAKSAMTEGLADARNYATEAHRKLYQRWADGGLGLSITGNVQIDPDHLERPGNIVICGEQSNQQLDRLAQIAKAGTSHGGHIWMQISHAGRQTQAIVNKNPKAPSSVALNMPKGQFGKPQEMTLADIDKVIKGFAFAASIAKKTGFTGVQIHSAHGYLLSSFLSPLSNRRSDAYGGSLQNRAKLLLEVVRATRAAVGDDFPLSVKLNSADFQQGGYDNSESIQVAQWLQEASIDLLEISGGNYESAAMMGAADETRQSTKTREAYFLEYAANIRKAIALPLMVTGGFRSREAMLAALNSGDCELIGMARPLCTDTNLPKELISGERQAAPKWEGQLGFLRRLHNINIVRLANAWGVQGWFCLQLIKMGAGQDPNPKMSPFLSLFRYMANENRTARDMHKARAL